MLGAGLVRSNEREVDLSAVAARQLTLGLLSGFLQTLQSHRVLTQVDAVLTLEFGHQPVDYRLVEVVTAQMRVAVGRLDFKNAVAELEDGNIERTPAQVIDRNLLVFLLVQAIGQRSRSGLVDDALDFQTGNTTRILGRLTLAVVEICRNGDHRFGNGLAQISLGICFELLQYHGRNLGRRIILVANLHVRIAVLGLDQLVRNQTKVTLHFTEFPAHETLDGKNRLGGIGHRLTLGLSTYQTLAILGKSNYRRSRAAALSIRNHDRLATFYHRHAGIRGS